MHTIVDYTSKIKGFFSSKQELKESYAVAGKLGAKQLLIYPYPIKKNTSNGVTWDASITDDGKIIVNGQPTDYTSLELVYYNDNLKNDYKLEAGDYVVKMDGCEGKNVALRVRLVYPGTGNTIIKAQPVRPTYKATFNISSQEAQDIAQGVARFEARIFCQDTSAVFSNTVIAPMIYFAADTSPDWEPYAMSNRELTDDIRDFHASTEVMNLAEKKINITAFGGKPDVNSLDNSQNLIQAINYAMTNGYTLYVPRGVYYIKSTINITNDLVMEGETNFGHSASRYGSTLHFSPGGGDIDMFYDSSAHKISIRNLELFCSYTHFTSSLVEVAETPHNYFTWAYDYDNVNCLNIRGADLFIENVSIAGFSGFGLSCSQNKTVTNVSVIACKYGFYNCKTDVLFDNCYVSKCEKAFYWDSPGTVIFAYDVWIDLCGYGFYSLNELSGEISGLIDHCLYAGIYAYNITSGLNFNGRMGRCGMYYTGTDMVAHAPQVYSDAAFEDMSKGVFVAIRRATGLNLNINCVPRAIDDSNVGVNKLPTLIVFGNTFNSSVIKTAYNHRERTCKVMDSASEVLVVNCESLSTEKLKAVTAASADFADFQTRIAAL